MNSIINLAIAGAALLCTVSATASELSYAPLQAGYRHHLSSDIDGGGSASKGVFQLKAGVPLVRETDLSISLTSSFRLDAYDFSGGSAGSLAALNPWEDIYRYQLGTFIRWDFKKDWSLIATPSVRSNAESGASLSDSLQAGGIIGISHKISDTLTIGSGFGYQSQIEDSASVYPILLIQWKINEALTLTTSPPAGATPGPGLALRWDISDESRFTVGFSYENNRFRLDKDSAASAGGVGEESGIPLYGVYTWKSSEHTQTSIIAGVKLGGELRLEDKSGNKLIERDSDAAPFIGINVGYTF